MFIHDIRPAILAFAFGIWLLQQQAVLPPYEGLVALTIILALSFVVNSKFPYVTLALRVLILAGLGFYWAAWVAESRLSDALPLEWEDRDIELIGIIASLPQETERGLRFELDVERTITLGAIVPRHIALSANRSSRYSNHAVELPHFAPGERWQFTVRLKRPHSQANPNGFDYAARLLEQNIRASGYIRIKAHKQRLTSFVPRPGYMLDALRHRIAQRFSAALGTQPYAGVIRALAIGDQSAIPAEQWNLFSRTGITHLISISGLHITMVSGLAFAFMYGLWRRSSYLTQVWPARRAASYFGLAIALVYSLLAGFTIPTQRTFFMLAVVAFALSFNRIPSVSWILSVALFVVLLIDPWAVLAPGFWLSFTAVGIILYVGTHRLARPHWLREWLSVQWAITLGLVPVLLILFQQVSLISPIANALAIPVISFLVVPLTLLGIVLPLDFFLTWAHLILDLNMRLLEYLSHFTVAVWQQHAPAPWTVLLAVIGLLWLFLPKGFPARWLGAVALLPVFMVLPPSPATGAFWLTVLDVGQGLSAVVRTHQHTLLYDAGPSFGLEADSGTRVILPYLRSAGINRLSGMVISHSDNDHSGGAISVLKGVPTDWLASSLPSHHEILRHTKQAYPCFAGQSWVWDDVRFEMLHPHQESYTEDWWKDNARSCVLKISTRAGSALLPGDIERDIEQRLLKHGAPLTSTLVVAPHHGSKTSSTPEFVSATDPAAVVYSVGYRNRFKHPRPEVTERYRTAGSLAFRTDTDGAVTVYFEDQTRLATYRNQYRRYWHEH